MKVFYLFLLMFISPMMHAQNAIAIHHKDGQIVKFAFSEKPIVTYSDNTLVLTTIKTTVEYPIALLKKLYFDIEMTTDVVEVKKEVQFCFQNETLFISEGEARSIVQIYNMNGLKVAQYRLDNEGNATIPMQTLNKDIYVVKTKMFTFKFKKS